MFSAAVLTAGAVTDVVTNQVRNHSGVARIVFRNAGFNLAHEVSTDVGRLGVDATTELREQCDETGTESVADDQKRNFRCPLLRAHSGRGKQRDDREQSTDTEQRH